ncbi:MAG: DUF2284 domain-containing protein [Eubacteriaceae bacterium]|nr:DUF2284 domain-containing protein [Eubacteriaceae bacterium]
MDQELLSIVDGFQFDQVAQFSTSIIKPVKSLYEMCSNGRCRSYNSRYSCPPAVGTFESLQVELSGYKEGIVLGKVYQIGSNFDFEGMIDASREFGVEIVELKKAFQNKGIEAMVMGSGGCRVCEECSYPDAPCQHPEIMIRSISCFGINVGQVVRDCGLSYNSGDRTVAYFSFALSN